MLLHSYSLLKFRKLCHSKVPIISELFLTFAPDELTNFDLRIINKHILGKLIRKNRGNSKLIKSVEQLIGDIENSNWGNPHDLIETRPDANLCL